MTASRNSHPGPWDGWKSYFARYSTLVFFKTYADLRAESQRTYIGYLWWIIDPVVGMAVYYLVFDVIFSSGIENFAVFIFIGLVPWRWFQTGVMSSSSAILNARGIMLQVYLPKVVFPLVAFLTNTFKFLVVFVLLVVALGVAGFPVGWFHLGLLPILATQALFIVGLGLIVAAVTPFFPDLRMVLDNVMRLWFFLSAIFYPIEGLGDRLRFAIKLNPMAVMIDEYRQVVMYGQWPDFTYLAGTAILSLVLIAIGVGLISRFDYVYPRLSP